MSRNEQTGIVSNNAVTHVFVEQHTTDVRLLKVSDAQGNVVAITVSDEHPIFVTGKGWLFADELHAGDSLQSLAGEPLTVVSNIEDDQPLSMYNLEVANDHTYGVTDEQVWVHNACINLPSWKRLDIDLDHIISGHTVNGSRVLAGSKKDLFPIEMTEAQIKSAVIDAYKNGKKVATQGDRVKIRGNGIEMWVNLATETIETAYPLKRALK